LRINSCKNAYRKNKSAHGALDKAKERSYLFHWVVDLDIKGFFDNIDHSLLIKALERHVTCKWAIMSNKSWLTVPSQLKDAKKDYNRQPTRSQKGTKNKIVSIRPNRRKQTTRPNSETNGDEARLARA